MKLKEYKEKQKNELREIASKLLNDQIYFIEGIRLIKDRIDTINLDDEDIKLLSGIDSDTDDVPVGNTRKLWSKEALQKVDKALIDYIESVKPQIKSLCKKIMKIIDET